MPQVVFDGQCPFCSDYVSKLQLENTVGKVELIDARTDSELVTKLESQGYELDRGMVFIQDGNYYFGHDAMHRLALLSTKSGWFNRFNNWLFSIKPLAFFIYPLLRLGRNSTLLLMGREPIQQDATKKALFKLFTIIWAMFCLLHVAVYSTQYERASFITSVGVGVFALILLLKPGSKPFFITTIILASISAISQMPVISNHSQVTNFFLLSALLLGIYHSLRGSSWALFFQQLCYAGRGLLLTMYLFGVLHKINSDFLNPDVSCAVTLWREMPYFLSWLDFSVVHYLTIYGTLIGETVIAICLLVPRWRHLGIVSGMAFHALLGLSGYAMYPPFSTLCIALHCCFLSPLAAQNIIKAQEWAQLWCWFKSVKGLIVGCGLFLMLLFTAWIKSYAAFGILWLLLISPFLFIVARYGNEPATAQLQSDIPSKVIVSSIILLFLFNGFTPYLGLKTAQSINMFANLRLEADVSNHLIFTKRPGPWHYLDDVVTIEHAGSIAALEYAKSNNLGVVYYQLLHYLQQNPAAKVNFMRDNVLHKQQSAESLQQDITDTLHPAWVRKVLHFNVVDFTTPKPCALDR
ncbi:DCC1-like thiol-disulfide oxidoreductase family protein [Rheinheimera aquimaris]|uniref:DCC1-like thiol-disulfide oxidoreductase family protein n=1 Tax=Rheinheimera aquimaris TaxID=412437 RepID=UPI003A972D68